MKTLLLSSALVSLLPALAAAQGFEGAYISLERLSYSSDDFSGNGSTEYYGSSIASVGGEFSFGSGLAVSADLTNYGGDIRDDSATLHAFYRIGEVTAVGAFFGIDQFVNEDFDSDTGYSSWTEHGNFYGVEGRARVAGTALDAFVGQTDTDDTQGVIYGISAEYGIAGENILGSWGLTASYAAYDDSDFATDRLALGGLWHFDSGVTVYSELGQRTRPFGFYDGSATVNFLSLGIRIGVGPNKGTTFGPRSVREILF
jgi:hypothetical protein